MIERGSREDRERIERTSMVNNAISRCLHDRETIEKGSREDRGRIKRGSREDREDIDGQ